MKKNILHYESYNRFNGGLQNHLLMMFNVIGYSSPSDPYEDKALPNGCTSLIFHFGEKISVSNVKYNGKKIPKYYVLGPYTSPIKIKHTSGKIDVFTVIFKPLHFYQVFDIPVGEFKNVLVDLKAWDWKIEMKELINDLASQDFKTRVETFSNYLRGKLKYKTISSSNFFIANKIIKEITLRQGFIGRVSEFLKKIEIYKSEKRVRELLREHNGTTIKEYADAIRSTSILRLTQNAKIIQPNEFLEEFGYYDYSHFLRDFRKFTTEKFHKFNLIENKVAELMLSA